jgi:hypothetical protein
MRNDLSDNSLESVLEPLNCLFTLDLVGSTDVSLASATLGNTLTRTGPRDCQEYVFIFAGTYTYMQA